MLAGESEPKTWQEAALTVANEIAALISQKQRRYGQKNVLRFGEHGVVVRSSDKFERLLNLLAQQAEMPNPEVFDKDVVECWVDIAGHALIALMLRRGWFTLELDESWWKELPDQAEGLPDGFIPTI